MRSWHPGARQAGQTAELSLWPDGEPSLQLRRARAPTPSCLQALQWAPAGAEAVAAGSRVPILCLPTREPAGSSEQVRAAPGSSCESRTPAGGGVPMPLAGWMTSLLPRTCLFSTPNYRSCDFICSI